MVHRKFEWEVEVYYIQHTLKCSKGEEGKKKQQQNIVTKSKSKACFPSFKIQVYLAEILKVAACMFPN